MDTLASVARVVFSLLGFGRRAVPAVVFSAAAVHCSSLREARPSHRHCWTSQQWHPLARALALLTSLLLAHSQRAIAETAEPEVDPSQSKQAVADLLVRRAVEAELAGDNAQRRDLLALAVFEQPDHQQARWQSGKMKFDGAWRSPEAVSERVARDPRWQEYRRLRGSSSSTPADHAALARWCDRNQLAQEARWHWMNVLRATPRNEEAQQALGLHPYQGGLYSRDEIERIKKAQQAAQRNLARWRPILSAYRRGAESDDTAERTAALDKLRAIDDVRAVDALVEMVTSAKSAKRERQLAAQRGKEAARQMTQDVCGAVIAVLGRMPQQEATLALLDCAVFSPTAEMRAESARALRPRQKTSYVPLLLEQLKTPVQAHADVAVSPLGGTTVSQEFYREGPIVDQSLKAVYAEGRIWTGDWRRDPGPEAIASVNLKLASRSLSKGLRSVEKENARTQQTNERTIEVLTVATEMDLGSDPKAWWDEWKRFNELHIEEEHPVNKFYVLYQSGVSPPSSNFPVSPSCFVAGTPVWTESGPVAIEQVTIGDMVLSQNAQTGELAYRPVTVTTTRPPTATVRITLGDETLTATLGHRFWVNGQGWRMAKFLEVGDRLHGTDGAVRIEAIEPGDDVEAYNLAVDQFNTYFVGEGRLLVHDNTCPRPTLGQLPGVEAPKRESLAAGK